MAFKIKNVCNKPSLGWPLEGFEGEFRKSWAVFTTLLVYDCNCCQVVCERSPYRCFKMEKDSYFRNYMSNKSSFPNKRTLPWDSNKRAYLWLSQKCVIPLLKSRFMSLWMAISGLVLLFPSFKLLRCENKAKSRMHCGFSGKDHGSISEIFIVTNLTFCNF